MGVGADGSASDGRVKPTVASDGSAGGGADGTVLGGRETMTVASGGAAGGGADGTVLGGGGTMTVVSDGSPPVGPVAACVEGRWRTTVGAAAVPASRSSNAAPAAESRSPASRTAHISVAFW
jgi:hypothetical protein